MESTLALVLRLSIVVGVMAMVGCGVAIGVAAWIGATSVLDMGQAVFYAGIVMVGLGAFLAMPFQGVGGMSAGGAVGMQDFSRMMTLATAEMDFEQLHKRDKEHTARSMPLAFCLFLAGILLTVAGVIVTWVAWSN